MSGRTIVDGCANPVLAEGLHGWGSLDGAVLARTSIGDHAAARHAARSVAVAPVTGWYLPELAVRAGERWAVGIDVRVDSGGAARVEMDWYDASGEFLSSTSGGETLLGAGAVWTHVSTVFTAPAGAVNSHPLLRMRSAAGGAHWWATAATYRAVAPAVPAGGDDGVQAAVVHGWGPVVDGDEFDYTGAPRADRWSTYDGPGHAGNGRRTPSAFSVAGGVLTNHGAADGSTGGMAFRSGRGSRHYRMEARMRLYNVGAAAGHQYHPVLLCWPDSEQWPQGGEDDWAETDIGSGRMEAFIHWPGDDGSAQSCAAEQVDITRWHNYAVERAAGHVAGFIDGVEWFRFTDRRVLRIPGPMHPVVQLDCFHRRAVMQPANQDLRWLRIYAPPR
jgi:hypothetical protein